MTTLKPGDHVIPLYTPECRQCKFCLSRKTNLCQPIRATQGKGLMPDGSQPLLASDGKPILHYMGTSTFANYTVVPEIALAKIRDDAPFDKVCYIGCGVTTGIGAVIYTAKVEAGANVVVFGLGGIGLNVIQGARMVGADKIIGVDINPAREAMARQLRHDALRQPEGGRRTWSTRSWSSPTAAPTTASSASATSTTMRQALECCHKGWGRSVIIGVAGGRRRRSRRGRSSSSPAASGRARPSAARAAAPTCRRSSTGTWTARSTSTTLITHTLPLEDINEGFDLMKRGESIRSVVVY